MTGRRSWLTITAGCITAVAAGHALGHRLNARPPSRTHDIIFDMGLLALTLAIAAASRAGHNHQAEPVS